MKTVDAMKRLLTLVMVLVAASSLAAEQIPCAAPEFIQCIFDQYSVNYLNAQAIGRGHTGVATAGGVNSVLINPASLELDAAYSYFELFLKPSIEEMNTKVFENNNNDAYVSQNYISESPFGIVGFGMPAGSLYLAFTFSTPQSLEYDSFARELNSEDEIILHPSFVRYQFATTLATRWRDFSFGLNLLADLYSQKDYRSYWQMGRQDTSDWLLRAQAGVRWRRESLELGVAYTPAVDKEFDLDYQEEYDTTIPAVLTAGAAWRLGSVKLLADVEHQACSQQSSYYDDRIRLKFGVEKYSGPYTLRAGAMHVSGVYSGEVAFPDAPDSISVQNTYYLPKEDQAYIVIPENDQLFITGGISYAFRSGDLHLGVMADVLGDVPVVQLYTSFSLNMESFKKFMKRD